MKNLEEKIDDIFQIFANYFPQEVKDVRKPTDALTFCMTHNDWWENDHHLNDAGMQLSEVYMWNGDQQGGGGRNPLTSVVTLHYKLDTIPKRLFESVFRDFCKMKRSFPFSKTDRPKSAHIKKFFEVPRNGKSPKIVWNVGKYFYTNDATGIGIYSPAERVTNSKEVANIWVKFWLDELRQELKEDAEMVIKAKESVKNLKKVIKETNLLFKSTS